MAFAGFLLLGLGASGLGPWGVWLLGYEPLSPVWGSPEAFGMAGGARGWVAGRAGFWGALATWVWGRQLQPPGPWHPTRALIERYLG